MNNENVNNSNNNHETEIIDASLLNPFQSAIKESAEIENNHTEVNNNQNGSNSLNEVDNGISESLISSSLTNNIQASNPPVNEEPIHNTDNSQESNNDLQDNVSNSVDNSPISTPNNEQVTNNQENLVGNNIDVDDELLDAYIGPNAQKIKKQGISWPTFWLGMYYTLYRKMWFLSFAMFVVSIVSTIFLPSLSRYITLCLGIFIFISFNKMYINHAKEEIKKIIIQNPNASREELLNKCRSKGGTSIIAVILTIVAYVGLQVYVENMERNKITQWGAYVNIGGRK